MTIVFVFDLKRPLKPVKAVEAEIRSTKWSWAILPDGKRKLIGSSAFFTPQAAQRSRIAMLVKETEDKYLRRFYPDYVVSCKKEIDKFKA